MLEKNIDLNNKVILVTGSAGFIGSSLINKLVREIKNTTIIGVDNLNEYYDIKLKKSRMNETENIFKENENKNKYLFEQISISNKEKIDTIFDKYKPDIVVNLAAQAGVRYSILNPSEYIESNIIGFYNVIEACRSSIIKGVNPVKHLIYASSSSVYGDNKKIPYSTNDKTDSPVSLYAATKKSNELLAYSYSKLYKIPMTGLRFFTVYGPAGRPDMAYYGFTNKFCNDEKIQVYNYGNCKRDFTYIDDIVDGILKVMEVAPIYNDVHHKVYNIGNNTPETLKDFIEILQEELVREKILPLSYDFEKNKDYVPMQQGDVEVTYADISDLEKDFGFKPNTKLREGISEFVKWYKVFYSK